VTPARRQRSLARLAFALLIVLVAVDPPPVHAYIGPGAGFAVVSSFLTVFGAFLLAFWKLFTWPLRFLFRALRARKAHARSRVQRVVVLGLDGQDPELTDRFLGQGLLPNFARLRERGSYVRLETSYPAESPVAWSSFQTGCNPGRHRVFDFLVPNRKSHLPELCSAKVTHAARVLALGRYRLPLGRPSIDLGRKSQPFWKILGDHGIFSAILRVPITFPPEKFRGTLLSAMCVPDLKGSQGTFSYYTTDRAEQELLTGGMRVPVQRANGAFHSWVSGPENTLVAGGGEMRIPFEVRPGADGAGAELRLGGKSHALRLREYTPWIELEFRPALRFKVRGIARFYLKQLSPELKLYMTPVQVDPDRPALPISHPKSYATYLSKLHGRYATLGLAEDTWGLNERVLDERAFLDQVWLIHDERERMFFDALEKVRRGSVVCVFDVTDRLQHMFFRYLEPDHPANAGKDTTEHRDAIRELYVRMDRLVGRVLDAIDDRTVLMVMSDHGFKPFRRGVNLNSWLHRHGYLSVKDQPTGAPWYQDVDWSRTRAYAVGLGGIYLNQRGREAQGTVEPGQAAGLKDEIRERLRSLEDSARGCRAVAEVYDTARIYRGPYVKDAPDLFAGFRVGYRASWHCATGVIDGEIFEDNVKSWSGDHCMNPPDVPGIFFCSRKLGVKQVNIMDIAPTVLDLFGIPAPPWYDGKSFLPAEGERRR
jgi:predicted AlkP superfamily phosphohydrolase/phosphomutase